LKLSFIIFPQDVHDKSDSFSIVADNKQEFSNDFDLRKPLERHLLNGQNIECVSTQDADNLRELQDHCSTFFIQASRVRLNFYFIIQKLLPLMNIMV
jgi:hypothetical protein